MHKLKKYLGENSYIVALTVVTVIVGVLHFATNDNPTQTWLKQSSANLFITILGIWVTVLCIDQIIKQKELREKKRLLNIAYLEVSRALNFYLFYLDRIYRVSSNGRPVFKKTYNEMYNCDHFKEAFINCDFTKIAEYQNCTWGQFMYSKTNDFIASIDNIISKYSFVLDTDTLSQLELLKGSSFVLVSPHMENPEGKREVIYQYYNEFLNHLFFIAEILIRTSDNPRYSLSYSQDMWSDENSAFDRLGSARFDRN